MLTLEAKNVSAVLDVMQANEEKDCAEADAEADIQVKMPAPLQLACTTCVRACPSSNGYRPRMSPFLRKKKIALVHAIFGKFYVIASDCV
jgi:hypothetical protein